MIGALITRGLGYAIKYLVTRGLGIGIGGLILPSNRIFGPAPSGAPHLFGSPASGGTVRIFKG